MSIERTGELLIIIGLIFIGVEIIVGVITGFDLLLIGITLIIGGITTQITSSPELGLITTIVLSAVYMLIGRSHVKKMLAFKTNTTNIDSIMGKNAVVVKTITKHKPGQIKINGEVWRAESDRSISKGSVVMVQSVEGVTVKVRK